MTYYDVNIPASGFTSVSLGLRLGKYSGRLGSRMCLWVYVWVNSPDVWVYVWTSGFTSV